MEMLLQANLFAALTGGTKQFAKNRSGLTEEEEKKLEQSIEDEIGAIGKEEVKYWFLESKF